MVLGDSNCACNFTCNGTIIESSKEEKVLGIPIDDKLTFTSHLGNIIKNAFLMIFPRCDVKVSLSNASWTKQSKCCMGFEQNELTHFSRVSHFYTP